MQERRNLNLLGACASRYDPGSDLPGGWGFNPPNDFFDPRVSVDLSSCMGVDSNSSIMLHVSACGASTLLPVGDPPMFFFHKSVTDMTNSKLIVTTTSTQVEQTDRTSAFGSHKVSNQSGRDRPASSIVMHNLLTVSCKVCAHVGSHWRFGPSQVLKVIQERSRVSPAIPGGVPLPRIFYICFWSENGEFWCIIGWYFMRFRATRE